MRRFVIQALVLLTWALHGETARAQGVAASPGAAGKDGGLVIGGLVTLGASYGISAVAGLQLRSEDYCSNCQSTGGWLLVPVVGPWAAIRSSGSDGKPLLAVLGVVQALGVVMAIVGASRLDDGVVAADARDPRDRKPPPRRQSNVRLGLLVVPTRDGAAVMVSGSF
jgi:hypothetical protein